MVEDGKSYPSVVTLTRGQAGLPVLHWLIVRSADRAERRHEQIRYFTTARALSVACSSAVAPTGAPVACFIH